MLGEQTFFNMDPALTKQYLDFTRYIRPVKNVSFTDREMLQCLVQYLDPDEMASATQLMGDRKGVIRVTFRSRVTVKKLEELVTKRKLNIHAVPIGMVDDNGSFLIITLDSVPQYISEDAVEEVMCKYGTVAGSSRDYVEYKGKRIENERRKILYTALLDKVNIPREIKMFGTIVFATVRGQETCGVCKDHGEQQEQQRYHQQQQQQQAQQLLQSSVPSEGSSGSSRNSSTNALTSSSTGSSTTTAAGVNSPGTSTVHLQSYSKQKRTNAVQLLDNELK